MLKRNGIDMIFRDPRKVAAGVVGILVGVAASLCFAQTAGPYLYTVSPGQLRENKFLLNFDTGYGVRAVRPFGEDGVEQRAGVVWALSRNLSVATVAGAWVNQQSAVRLGSVQTELMWHVGGVGRKGTELAVGVGYLREYLGTNVLLARLAAGRSWRRWMLHGNLLFEKPLDARRDPVDWITSAGASWQFRSGVRLGVEAIGEDLEGFFEPEEAEGGAKVWVGPVVDVRVSSKARLRLGGGPIFYMTRSQRASAAPRLLPPGGSGYAVRTSLLYGF